MTKVPPGPDTLLPVKKQNWIRKTPQRISYSDLDYALSREDKKDLVVSG
ncbi:hypothetical protein [Methanoregula sp.]|jgi:hypothetical protein|nr:hypothetical protein [Methanoregula sp.]